MKTILLAACLVAGAGQAQALRCAAPNLTDHYRADQTSTLETIIVHGVFTPISDMNMTVSGDPDQNQTQTMLRFRGDVLTPDGFVPRPDVEVASFINSIGPWHGHPPPIGVRTIAFLRVDDAGYALHNGPCGSDAIAPVSQDDVDLVEFLERENDT